ncbi:hypothetical protein [Nostoc sp. NOS(2021)]|uniref:hypothetical protein n=1 Tax=Nostoc sp. NOS(2021) TaxID=2815407 RepID=UPI0025F4AFD8|nr:hypothetical protein [Nostoc sp. NOS(2021)]
MLDLSGAKHSGKYNSSRLSDVQEPHPQPPPRTRGACSDVPYVIRKRYITPESFTEF